MEIRTRGGGKWDRNERNGKWDIGNKCAMKDISTGKETNHPVFPIMIFFVARGNLRICFARIDLSWNILRVFARGYIHLPHNAHK